MVLDGSLHPDVVNRHKQGNSNCAQIQWCVLLGCGHGLPGIFTGCELRNLLWATSKHDVYTAQNYSVEHWSSMQQSCTEVLNVAGQVVPTQILQEHRGPLVQSVSRVQLSSMAVRENLLAAGGFQGELICKYLDRPGVVFCTKVTNDENAITNSVDIYQDMNGSTLLMAANNDCSVSLFE